MKCVCVILLLHHISFVERSTGFVPDYGFGLLGLVAGEYHVDVTRDALKFVAAQYFNEMSYRPEGSKKIPLTDALFGLFGWSANNIFKDYYGKSVSSKSFSKALGDIEMGVSRVDHEANMKDNPHHHFDAERFDEANQVLIDFRMQTINLILAENYEAARDTLGVLLHTLQDFYSHSNWIELGNELPNGNLGLSGKSYGRKAPYDMPTCTDCTTKCILGICGSYKCNDNLEQELTERNLLTSGYYGGQFDGFAGVEKPTEYAKCSHGGPFDSTQNSPPVGGINKDSSMQKLSPHYYLHNKAKDMAKMATIEFVNGVRHTLQDDYKFGMFLGLLIGPALTFFVDIVGTDNVTDKVASVTKVAQNLIEESRKTGSLPNFVLVPHNRPDFPSSVKTMSGEDINDFIGALISKQVKSHDVTDDYRETGELGGIKRALDASTYGSDVFLFSRHEEPSDPELLPEVLHTARLNRLQINVVDDHVFAEKRRKKRSTGEPSIFDVLVDKTGGSFVKPDTDLSRAFGSTFRQKDSRQGLPITIMYTKFTGDLSKWLNFTIDSSVITFSVTVTSSSPDVTVDVYSPMGQTRLDNMITDDNETTITIRTISDNEVGLWKMYVRTGRNVYGEYGFTVKVKGYSNVYHGVNLMTLDDITFAHPGLHTIPNRPIAGLNYSAICFLSDHDASLTSAQLTDANGEFILAELELKMINEMGRFHSFFVAPATPFLIRVVGESAAGQTLIRMGTVPFLFSHYDIRRVIPETPDEHLMPGTRFRVSFNVSCLHSDDSQRVIFFEAHDDREDTWIEDYSPRSTVLRGDGWFVAKVTLKAPSNAKIGETVRVYVTAGVRGTPDENWLDVNITVFPRHKDQTQPKCHVISSSYLALCTDRASIVDHCEQTLWSAALVFWDIGAGLSHTKKEVNGGKASVTLSNYNFQGFVNKNVTAIVKGDCCVESLAFRVYDKSGLQGACIFEKTTNSNNDDVLPWQTNGNRRRHLR